ncbi:hypothetical protein GLA29479_4581 [Lysobacter antibioticus]|nr:hypothetical protein GLA29479_4581 [Lysobacter antibioticus]
MSLQFFGEPADAGSGESSLESDRSNRAPLGLRLAEPGRHSGSP